MKKVFYNPDAGLLIFRLFVGLAIAFAHGIGKMPPSEQLVAGVAALGFPAPLFFAWAAFLSEFIGSLFIAAGLFTRIAAGFLGVSMAVAAFVVHSADTFDVKEKALFYLFSCILLLFTGAGKYSLGRIVCKK